MIIVYNIFLLKKYIKIILFNMIWKYKKLNVDCSKVNILIKFMEIALWII
jgi:hypothetical protein